MLTTTSLIRKNLVKILLDSTKKIKINKNKQKKRISKNKIESKNGRDDVFFSSVDPKKVERRSRSQIVDSFHCKILRIFELSELTCSASNLNQEN